MVPDLNTIWTRFARFGFVGATGVVVNSAVLFGAHGLAGLPLLVASPLAVEAAILHNFVWNEHWTFRALDEEARERVAGSEKREARDERESVSLGHRASRYSLLATRLPVLPDGYLQRLGRFNLTSLGGLLIASSVLYVLAVYGGVHYLLANLLGIALATAWNFTTSLLWTWGLER